MTSSLTKWPVSAINSSSAFTIFRAGVLALGVVARATDFAFMPGLTSQMPLSTSSWLTTMIGFTSLTLLLAAFLDEGVLFVLRGVATTRFGASGNLEGPAAAANVSTDGHARWTK